MSIFNNIWHRKMVPFICMKYLQALQKNEFIHNFIWIEICIVVYVQRYINNNKWISSDVNEIER